MRTKESQNNKQDLYGFQNQPKLYDSIRPEYPPELINYIIDYVTSRQTAAILEINDRGCINSCALDIVCGTGLFTRKLAPFFKEVYGTDSSEKQLEIARVKNTGNQHYAQFDAYDLEKMNNYFGLAVEDVSLVSIATAIHWLDFDRLVSSLNTIYTKETKAAIVGYLPPKIINETLLTKGSLKENLDSLNGQLKDFYPKKFDHYNDLYNNICKVLQKYINFDVDCLMDEYKMLPFGKYYSSHEFKRVSIVKKNSLFELVEMKRSTSYYQLFRNDKLDQIQKGLVDDPVESFANSVLLAEGLIDGTGNNNNDCDRIHLMKSVKLDTLWTFFVHILHN